MFKRPRLEHKSNDNADQRSESPSSSSEPATVSSSSTSNVYPSWYRKMPEFTHRSDLLFSPVPQYHRIHHAPSFNERVPLTTPLTVHCPPPWLHYEPASYYNPFLSLHPQRFPFYHSTPPPSIYPETWVNAPFSNNKDLSASTSFNCRCNSCTMPTLNVCSTCKDGFRDCVSCRISESAFAAPPLATDAAPTSTTDAEVSSSSFQNSRFSSSPPTASEFAVPARSTTRDYSHPTSEAENSVGDFGAIDEISSSIAEAISSSGSPLRLDSGFGYE